MLMWSACSLPPTLIALAVMAPARLIVVPAAD